MNPLQLPERVRVLSLWHRWAAAVAAVADGRADAKSIETRRWPWPYEPGWLAIHAGLRADGELPAIDGITPERVEPFPAFPAVTPGALCALVWVARCRPLLPEDKPCALVYCPGLWAWELERVHRLAPVPMRGPQKVASVPRELILGALG